MKYKLTNPVIITSRLLPGVVIDGASISIDYSPRKGSRVRFKYWIDMPKGGGKKAYSYHNDDLCGGMGNTSLQAGLRSLLNFLAACGESVNYEVRTGLRGENSKIFPKRIAEWAAGVEQELSSLVTELEETPDLIKEVAE